MKPGCFCMLSEVQPQVLTPGCAPVYLNVCDLTPANDYFYWAGVGIFHTGIEVYGVEYAFGAHDYPSSGVFEVEPRQCPGFKFRKSIFMGTTVLDPNQIREFVECHSVSYYGNTYHLIVKNCNHFCKDVCYKLTKRKIPKWVNRLAIIGGSSCRWTNNLILRPFLIEYQQLSAVFLQSNTRFNNSKSAGWGGVGWREGGNSVVELTRPSSSQAHKPCREGLL